MSCVELFCEPIVLIIKRPFMPSGCWLCIESRACKEQTKPEVNRCSIFDRIQCLWVKLISRKIVVSNQFANEVKFGATPDDFRMDLHSPSLCSFCLQFWDACSFYVRVQVETNLANFEYYQIPMAWKHSLSSIRHCDIIHDANTTKMPVWSK